MIPSIRASGKTSFISRSDSDRPGSTFFTNSAMHTVTSATVEPTERSIPPAIMMIVMPRAAVPTITVWTAIVRQLSTVRNVPDWRVSAPKSKMIRTSPRNGPNTVQAQPRPPRSLIAGIACRVPFERPATAISLRPALKPSKIDSTEPIQSGSRLHDFVFGPLRDGACLTHRSARHDGDPVADSEQLGQVGADNQDRLARGGLFADQAIDLGLGADVDAAGRLVQEQDVGSLVEQSCQCHLLLVAAGKVRRDLARARRS